MRRTRINKSDSQLTLNNLFLQTRTKQLRNLCAESTRENSPVQNKAAVSRWPAQALHAHIEHEVDTHRLLVRRAPICEHVGHHGVHVCCRARTQLEGVDPGQDFGVQSRNTARHGGTTNRGRRDALTLPF
jgi:hypothetical protein